MRRKVATVLREIVQMLIWRRHCKEWY